VRSRIGTEVGAPPDLVYRLARDVTRWERLLPHYARSRVVRREADGSLVCDFVARRVIVPWLELGIPVAWRSRTWLEPDTRRLRFHHLAGATRGMDVIWTIEPIGPGQTRIEISHDFRPRVPGFARFVDRLFTRPIAGRTLATMRDLAEALAIDDPASGPSAASDATPPADP
jgi:ribosome-associated toxin RatA of RatAB toxin-antitoxin module